MVSFVSMMVVAWFFLHAAMSVVAAATTDGDAYYVCAAGDARFLGEYTPSSKETNDGVPVYFNEKDMALFRNKGFWYAGDVEPWPPLTSYRCVQPNGCNYNVAHPPTSKDGAWAVTGTGKPPAIDVSRTPCSGGASGNNALANEEL
jgi:hypothetical protein